MPVSNTQGKKTSGGSFTTVTTSSTNLVTTADATVAAAAPQVLPQVVSALNSWHACAGVGDAATRAQKIANAAGVTIQEV